MASIVYGQGLTHPRHLAIQPKTGCLFVAEDSTKDVWCFTQQQPRPYRRVASGVSAPNGVAFDRAGDLLVVDFDDGVVVRLAGEQPPQPVICGLKNPYGLAVDAEGQIVVADAGNEAVKVFAPDGDYALRHEFRMGFRPVDVAILGDGRLVVVSYSGELVVLDPKTGRRRHHHQCAAEYGSTVGLAVDADDRIYVTQHLHKQVIVFDQELNCLGPVDGLPDLSMAWGLKAVGGGNSVTLYVAEQGRVSVFPVGFKPSLKKK